MKAAPQRATKAAVPAPAAGGTPTTLTERVYATLKRDIITGALRPGAAFTEKELADSYEASRTPVREATVRLQEEGLVRIVPNRGYFVTQLTIQQLNDVYEFRAVVEAACAGLLSHMNLPAKVLEELKTVAKFRTERQCDFGAFIAADTAFHLGIARLTQNALLVRAVGQMRAQTERVMFAAAESIDQRYYSELPAREHMAILEAIRSHDAVTARRLMHQHIIGGKNKVLEFARRHARFL